MSEFSLARMLEEAATSSSSLDRLFEEEPVDLKTFINDKKYLGLTSFELSPPQVDLVRHIEQIYYPETIDLLAENETDREKLVVGQYVTRRIEPYWSVRYRMTNKITAMWGKGGGKDSTVRVGTLRIIYLLLCLKSPQVYYDMPDVDSIHTLNIASSAPQALRAFFDPIRRAVKTGWLADKCEPTKNQIEFDKNIIAISGHSQAESQEGLNLILGVADEIDAFASDTGTLKKDVKASQTSAEYILNMLDSSASTRFPDIYKLVSISYPRYKGSPIMNLMQEAKDDMEAVGGAENSTYYISGPFATWEVNPRVSGKEKFATQYRKDPIEAAAKYECRPARATNPFFRNTIALMDCFPEIPEEPITVSYRHIGNTWEASYRFHPDFKPVEGAVYAMHADLAITSDRAGIAMAHVKKWNEYETIVAQDDGFEVPLTELRPEIKVDFVFSYEADIRSDPPREIQIRWARQLCFELIKRGFAVKRLTFDQFQSADSMQILQSHGIESDRVSMDRTSEAWRNLRDVIHDGRLFGYYRKLTVDELLGLTQLPNGKVDHPMNGCFVGETRIPLLDGTYAEIKDIADKETWVYSSTPEGRIVPGRARGRLTKHVSKLVDVVLDNGYVARCTPEHLWMLRDGSYKPAQDLIPGIDRLMPITWTWPVNGGYTRVTDKDGNRILVHRLVGEFFHHKALLDSEVVHHRDYNKINNEPENLEVMDSEEHRLMHANELWAIRQNQMREGRITWQKSDRFEADLAKRDLTSCWLGLSPEQREKRILAAAKANHTAPYREDITLDSLKSVAGAKTANEASRLLNCGRNVIISRLKKAGFSSWQEFVSMLDNNHKVRAVIPVVLETPVPVYDLEVDEWHNFALSGGVFVHNSKDEADALAGAVLGAIYLGGEEAEGSPARGYEPAVVEVAPHDTGLLGMSSGMPLGFSTDALDWSFDPYAAD